MSITMRMIKSRRMRWAGYVACMGDRRGAHRVSVRKSEGRRTCGRPRRRREDDNKMGLHEMEWAGMNVIYLAYNRGR
jgi:hypothetical protein